MADVIPPLARRFLRGEHAEIDPRLPALLEELRRVGATECWHKMSTFAEHLYDVYQILTLWGQDLTMRHFGLLHSAYSNSYVNLAVFKAEEDRPRVAELVGAECEALIYKFCVLQRHDLIYTQLLDKIPDGAPLEVPPDGVAALNIKTGEREAVDLYFLAQALVFTIADFSSQLFDWQDRMFENAEDGRLRYAGNQPQWLWPGEMKPGLWMHALSKMGALLASCNARLAAAGDARAVPLPPVFDRCSRVLSRADERAARDAYWRAVTELSGPARASEARDALCEAAARNPWIAEPHALLAQVALQRGDATAAEAEAREALRLFCEWGTAWDKRMSWPAWVAWTRAVLYRARAGKPWPEEPFGVLNYGMVE
ncbi:hypothetical protein Rsub_03096 [Raphidocelis subcapitata]|uniref:DUF6817 domain-containing protein n=1 Tax=Raphidocelis subcapitata TaxID=307507 RepID=A0A2V0P129_9CHLO|nr:hypothetical protein Rsub_03096 [Raphidocelis subcapitata]|eukprot:GBF90795.1 hypothetical protein Rsub_03096 [Raphidocelis subcapitata]